MKDKKQLILVSLYCGSLWGLAEATLGHALHQIPLPGIAGYVMFPVGIFFMVSAFRYSGQSSAIVLTALVAANIKLIDLFLPARSPFAVINPAVAILCESFAVGLVFRLKNLREVLNRLDCILGMALLWRVFYAFSTHLIGCIYPVSNFFELGWGYIVSFFLLESAVNAILIFLLYRIHKYFNNSNYFPYHRGEWNASGYFLHLRKHPALHTIPLIALATAVEFFLF